MKENVKKYKLSKVKDQFTDTTRIVRRNLLIASSLTIIFIMIGSDTNIDSIFGIKLKDNISIFIPIGALSIIVIYELITFLVYALIDFKSWIINKNEITYQFMNIEINPLIETLNKYIDLINIKYEKINNFKPSPNIIQSEFYKELKKVKEECEAMELGVHDSVLQIDSAKRIANIHTLVSDIENSINSSSELINNYNSNIKAFNDMIHDIKSHITMYQDRMNKYEKQISSFNFLQYFRIYIIDWGIPILLSSISIYLSLVSLIEFLMVLFFKLL